MQDQCAPRDPVHRLVEQGCGETKGERRRTAHLPTHPHCKGGGGGSPSLHIPWEPHIPSAQ